MDSDSTVRRPVFKIGIDFGTTYFAMAFFKLDRIENSVNVLPSMMTGNDIEKVSFFGKDSVRAQLAWDPQGRDWLWGPEVDSRIQMGEIKESDRLDMFKMGIDGSAHTAGPRKRLLEKIATLPPECTDRSPEALSTLFIRKAYEYGVQKIISSLTMPRPKEYFSQVDVECAFCVPIMWKPQIIHKLVSITNNAGLPNVEIVSEPEAAAMTMIHKELRPFMKDHTSFPAKIGTYKPFLVADIGGGTGDFICYIVWTPNNQSVKMRQGVPGEGCACGSALLNDKFRENFSKFTEKSQSHILEDLGMSTEETLPQILWEEFLDIAVSSFEEQKKGFKGEHDRALCISVPGLRRNSKRNLEQNRIKFPASRTIELFSNVIEDIIIMIERQILAFNKKHLKEKIETVMFVGGLSSNVYVVNRLEAIFTHTTHPRLGYPVLIATPRQNHETLVATGAVLDSLHKDVMGERFLSCSLGFCQQEDYDPALHPEPENPAIHGDRKVWNDYCERKIKVVHDRMHWLFRLGEGVQPAETRTLRGFRDLSPSGDDVIEEKVYYSCKVSEQHLPLHDKTHEIRELGRLSMIVNQEMKRNFVPRSISKWRRPYRQTDYEVRVTICYPWFDFEMILPKNGRFPEEPTGTELGPDPIRRSTRLNCASTFDLAGTQGNREHGESRASSATPLGNSIDNGFEADVQVLSEREFLSTTTGSGGSRKRYRDADVPRKATYSNRRLVRVKR